MSSLESEAVVLATRPERLLVADLNTNGTHAGRAGTVDDAVVGHPGHAQPPTLEARLAEFAAWCRHAPPAEIERMRRAMSETEKSRQKRRLFPQYPPTLLQRLGLARGLCDEL